PHPCALAASGAGEGGDQFDHRRRRRGAGAPDPWHALCRGDRERRKAVMNERTAILPPARPDFERTTLDARNTGEIERPLSLLERLTNITALRRFLLLVLLAVIWQAYAAWLDNPLIFPTFADTLAALVKG